MNEVDRALAASRVQTTKPGQPCLKLGLGFEDRLGDVAIARRGLEIHSDYDFTEVMIL